MPPLDEEFERTIITTHVRVADLESNTIGHYLLALEGAEPGKRVEVGIEPLTIGRDGKQALVFADNRVSRLHARVSLVNGDVVVEDLGSTNGTFVDAERLTVPVTLRDGSVLRVGSQVLRYERRSRRDVERSAELERDLLKARNYVLSLLPAPITTGPVRADWTFVPSTQLGGDAFGYYWLNPTTFVLYLIDVSGHGVGAAMHSVTVLNVLRQRALPRVDFENPAEVLTSLNNTFQMDSHDGMLLTMWYGVYRTGDRTLTYGAAGHHPAYLVPPDRREARPLRTSALMIGAMPELEYRVQHTTVPAGSSLLSLQRRALRDHREERRTLGAVRFRAVASRVRASRDARGRAALSAGEGSGGTRAARRRRVARGADLPLIDLRSE